MIGPEPRRSWMCAAFRKPCNMLRPGTRYRVIRRFVDHDHDEHPAGELWTYLGYNFLTYDDGLSLFVSLDDSQEWHIRMQLREDEQEDIVREFRRYVQPVE